MRLCTTAFLMFLSVAPLSAQSRDTLAASRPAQINLSASASVRAQPDRVTLYLLVDAPGPTPSDADARSQLSAENVADTLRSLGGQAVVVQVTSYGAGPASQMERGNTSTAATAYLGRTVVRVELSRLSQLPAIVEGAFARGATDLAAMRFAHSNPDSLRQVALAQALASLKADAATMANELGAGVGRLMHLSSNAGYNPDQQPLHLSSGTQYQSGQAWLTPPVVTISVNANATYQLDAPSNGQLGEIR